MKTTKLTLVALIVVAATILSGCNTIRGVGQDVSATGRGVSKGAGAVQSAM
jgi:predicted small secreted protein